jgi:hypothetical protein
MILFPLFAPVLLTPVAKFDTGINNTSGTVANFPPVSLTPVANLPLVSLILMVYLHLRLAPRICWKHSK